MYSAQPALRPPTERRLNLIPRTGYPAYDLKSTYCFCANMLLRSQFDNSVASFRTSAEDGDATASDTALPLPGVGGR